METSVATAPPSRSDTDPPTVPGRRRRLPAARSALLTAVLAVVLAGCHLGRPPAGPTASGVALAPVAGAVAEPALPDAVARGLARGLAGRGVGLDGPRLEVEILEAEVGVVGATGLRRVHRARLAVAFRLRGADPRDVVLRAERSYGVGTGDGLSAAAARARTFEALAEELAGDLAAWLALAPEGDRPSPAVSRPPQTPAAPEGP